MNKCKEIRSELSAMVDDELSPTVKAEVLEHVNACSSCQSYVAELRRLASGIAAFPSIPVTQEFVEDLEKRIRLERRAMVQPTWIDRLFRPVWLKLPIEALTAVAVVVTVMTFIRPSQVQTPEPVIVRKETILPEEILPPEKKMASKDVEFSAARLASKPDDVLLDAKGEGMVAAAGPPVVESMASPVVSTPPAPAKSMTMQRSTLLGSAQNNAKGTAPIVMRGDFSQVRQQAQSLATTFNGHVIDAKRRQTVDNDTVNSILVELPASVVNVFTQRLAGAISRQVAGGGLAAAQADKLSYDAVRTEEAAKESGEKKPAEKMTVLEIQVISQ